MKLQVFDDAMSDPGTVRDHIIVEGFRDVTLGAQTYHGINTSIPTGWHGEISDHLFEPELIPKLSFFCLSGEDHKLESGAYIHVDHVFAPKVAIVYLSTGEIPDGSGTAFWCHNKTGWETMPSQDELRRHGMTLSEFLEDWRKPECWRRVDFVQERFNRLAVFDANRFHSRWPIKGRGTTPENSRLIFTTWFSVP